METLELKHLAPYLPYNVMFCEKDEISETLQILNVKKLGEIMQDPLTTTCLILRPISDLTKEIEHNREKFVPLAKIREIFGGRPLGFDGKCFYQLIQKSIVRGNEKTEVPMHFSQLDAFNLLFEWHFDLYGLIEKGLAININTL